jgi:hypothetical protein
MNTREENVPSPTSPDKIVVELGTVCVLGRRHLRALAESADQLLERFGVWSCLIRLATGAQDCHGWGFEIGSDVLLQEVGGGDE